MPSPRFAGPPGMRLFRSQLESPDLRQFIKNIEQSTDQTVQDILEFVRVDMLRYLKDYTDVMRPPDFRVSYYGGDPKAPRPAHPGGWANISKELMKGYKAEVTRNAVGNHVLTIRNDSPAAVFVEAKEGFFVVTGIMEPGGPVDWSLRRAIKRLAPGWKVTAPGGTEIMAEADP